MKNLFLCEVFLFVSVVINYFFVVYFEFGVLASYLFFGILLRMLVGKVLFIVRFLLLSLMYWLGWMLINWLDVPIIVDSMDNYDDPS